MDAFYFKKYSRYVISYGKNKSGINLFLTLKQCRKSCYISIRSSRYEKSFIRILKYYKMNFEKIEDNVFVISKNPIPLNLKSALLSMETDEDYRIIADFLDYPIHMHTGKIKNMKEIGGIRFYFFKNSMDGRAIVSKNREYIYGVQIPNNKITPQMITKMNSRMRKYRKCIQKHLGILFPDFTIEMGIKMIH